MSNLVTVHKLVRKTEKIACDLTMVPYQDSFYEGYKQTCCDSFYDLSVASQLDPYEFYSREELASKKQNIYLYLAHDCIVGAVEMKDNEILHLFVNNYYKGLGYGKKTLAFSLNYLFEKNYSEAVLFVADLNESAKEFYLRCGFECTSTFTDDWS